MIFKTFAVSLHKLNTTIASGLREITSAQKQRCMTLHVYSDVSQKFYKNNSRIQYGYKKDISMMGEKSLCMIDAQPNRARQSEASLPVPNRWSLPDARFSDFVTNYP